MILNKRYKIYIAIIFILLVLVLLLLFKGTSNKKQHRQRVSYYSFEQLQRRGAIRIGIFHNYTDYFLYHGKASGLQYNVSKKMAEHYHMKAYYTVYDNYIDACIALMQNKVDVLAMPFDSSMADNSMFAITVPYITASKVLVQRKTSPCVVADDTTRLKPVADDSAYTLMIMKDIHSNRMPYKVLQYLCPVSWHLMMVGNVGYARMFAMLDSGMADAMVCNTHDIDAYMSQRNKLDTIHLWGTSMKMGWAVRKENITLCDSINVWLKQYTASLAYKNLCKKTRYQASITKQRTNLRRTNISWTDNLFKYYARHYDLDWRFVAALAYKESHFNPEAEGAGGASGIMQMMPITAQHLGHEDLNSVESQISAGCKLVARLVNRFKKAGVNDEDLYFFVAAAYNAGHKSIENAMQMAAAMNMNQYAWKDVEKAMIKMNDAKLMKKYGMSPFYKGKFTAHYTHDVMMSYMHYINMIDKE
ncbi:MAG: transglycosylase SLT domain-containing protein [Bacteroidales bacterium]|nr:transglycosylase SLT domain-containing protein [Bacteroidales bacterium]